MAWAWHCPVYVFHKTLQLTAFKLISQCLVDSKTLYWKKIVYLTLQILEGPIIGPQCYVTNSKECRFLSQFIIKHV